MASRIIAGGDIRQLTVGGRALHIAPESALKLSTGGKSNEVNLAGDGTPVVKQKTRVAGFSDCPVLNDAASGTLEYLQGLANDAAETSTVLTLVDGTAYGGQLMVVGDLDLDTGEGTIGLEMRGSTFEQIG